MRLAPCVGAIAVPDARRAHERPTPTCGGIAIYVGFWVGLLAFGWPPSWSTLVLLMASAILLVVSVIDDVKALSPILRLAVHVGVAVFVWAGFPYGGWPWPGGIQIHGVTWPLHAGGAAYLPLGKASLPVTVGWIVLVINAMNWLDGLDGLAAGVGAIAATTLALLARAMGSGEVAIMGAALAGAALGFLRYNVKPARVFMGDAGAMFLGLALASMSITGTLKGPTLAAIAVPVLALGVPIYDAVSTIIRRIRERKPLHVADRRHLHHRLLERGWSEEKVVVVLWLTAAALSVGALILLR
jgi:UDP-GlcNAc:undecaprenyl-phosphate/decaprenyl-phosphate GlcNAc-1-phosphate transferase